LTADALLRVADIGKKFGGIAALAGVSVDVPEGVVYGLIGPNGSGKTTLFNVITGFTRPDRGSVSFNGRSIVGMSPDAVARLGLCRTFQSSLCPARLTVMENMLLAPRGQTGEALHGLVLRSARVRAEERAHVERARSILVTVKIGAKADEYAGNLSGGQKKLLLLAQALMAEPRLILLDEPVAGVHPVLAREIADLIRRLRDRGHNFLIVEHNMSFIRRACDRIAVLDAGRIIAEGEPESVLAREDVLSAYLARQPGRAEPARA
jgi:ABC-type branched-subunit amino acid transport system ATPase component